MFMDSKLIVEDIDNHVLGRYDYLINVVSVGGTYTPPSWIAPSIAAAFTPRPLLYNLSRKITRGCEALAASRLRDVVSKILLRVFGDQPPIPATAQRGGSEQAGSDDPAIQLLSECLQMDSHHVLQQVHGSLSDIDACVPEPLCNLDLMVAKATILIRLNPQLTNTFQWEGYVIGSYDRLKSAFPEQFAG